MDYTTLMMTCRRCDECPLHETRKRVVFHRGNSDTDVMYIGGAPTEEDEQNGECFSGKDGQLLQRAMDSLGIETGDVLMTNILKCRPPGGAFPGDKKSKFEADPTAGHCSRTWLDEQVEAVSPKAMVLFGPAAAQWALYRGRDDMPKRFGDVVSRCYQRKDLWPGVKRIYVTWHPSHLLRGAPGVNNQLDSVMGAISKAKDYADALRANKKGPTGKTIVPKQVVTVITKPSAPMIGR